MDSHPGRLPMPHNISGHQQMDLIETVFDDLDIPAEIKEILDEDEYIPASESTHLPNSSPALEDPCDQEMNTLPPERRRLKIPSNCPSTVNINRDIEINQRVAQASRTLGILRDLIAEKSFQFSHVIRVASRKMVRTRARAYITKLNLRISYQCRVYTRCRSALVALNVGKDILEKYQILKVKDLASSTALVNPNMPGSTRLQLSWIWQTELNNGEISSAALRECTSEIHKFGLHIFIYHYQSTGSIGYVQGLFVKDGQKNLFWSDTKCDGHSTTMSIRNQRGTLGGNMLRSKKIPVR